MLEKTYPSSPAQAQHAPLIVRRVDAVPVALPLRAPMKMAGITITKAENLLVFKDTGSRILFRPVDEFERLRGTNLAWFGLDEMTYTAE